MSSEVQAAPKSKLIETAAALVYRQGWNATGINQILGEAKVPKGSFYYYFHSKEDLGVAIIQHHMKSCEAVIQNTFLNQTLSAREAIESYFTFRKNSLQKENWRWGCPVGSFSNEIVDNTEKIAEACREYFTKFHDALAQAIRRGQSDGIIPSERSADKLAMQISSIWQGSLLCMKTLKSEIPLQTGVDLISQVLFGGTH